MSLRSRLLGAFAYVLVLAVIALGVPLALSLRGRILDATHTEARAQADLAAATAGDLLGASARPALVSLARATSRSIRARVIVVDARGRVLVDSAGSEEVGQSYASRPELARALRGRPDQIQRFSATLGQTILATAVPVLHDGRVAGAVRITQSVADTETTVLRAEAAVAGIAAIVLALGLGAGAVLATGIGRPLTRLEAVARRIASGARGVRATPEGSREQRSLARSFNEMTAQLEELLEAQRTFVADASHELRTPLTAMRLRLEEARALTESPPANRELAAAVEDLDRLTGIVNELLALSRAEQREDTPAAASLSLAELARCAQERWSIEAAQRGLGLELEPGPDPPRVQAARGDAERALDVVIDNALRYSPPGTTVTLHTAPGRLEVRDRGPGIAPEERELVFARFHRGGAGRRGPSGHGLGLAIARELMRRGEGDVSLEPRPGGGSVARLSFRSEPAEEAGA